MVLSMVRKVVYQGKIFSFDLVWFSGIVVKFLIVLRLLKLHEKLLQIMLTGAGYVHSLYFKINS